MSTRLRHHTSLLHVLASTRFAARFHAPHVHAAPSRVMLALASHSLSRHTRSRVTLALASCARTGVDFWFSTRREHSRVMSALGGVSTENRRAHPFELGLGSPFARGVRTLHAKWRALTRARNGDSSAVTLCWKGHSGCLAERTLHAKWFRRPETRPPSHRKPRGPVVSFSHLPVWPSSLRARSCVRGGGPSSAAPSG